MAKFYQVSILGRKPSGGLFTDRAQAQREIGFLKADDRRHAADAMREAGITVEPTEYEIHEVEITL